VTAAVRASVDAVQRLAEEAHEKIERIRRATLASSRRVVSPRTVRGRASAASVGDAHTAVRYRWGISPRNSSPTSSSIRRPSPRTGC